MATTRLVLSPLAAEFPSANFAALTLINYRPVLAFDAATDETAQWTFLAPQGMTGTLTAVLSLIGGAASTNPTYWDVSVEAVTTADATDLDAGDSFDSINSGNVAMGATQGYMVQLSITLTNKDSVAAGDYVRVRVTRDANNASDTFAADAYLLAVEIREA